MPDIEVVIIIGKTPLLSAISFNVSQCKTHLLISQSSSLHNIVLWTDYARLFDTNYSIC